MNTECFRFTKIKNRKFTMKSDQVLNRSNDAPTFLLSTYEFSFVSCLSGNEQLTLKTLGIFETFEFLLHLGSSPSRAALRSTDRQTLFYMNSLLCCTTHFYLLRIPLSNPLRSKAYKCYQSVQLILCYLLFQE